MTGLGLLTAILKLSAQASVAGLVVLAARKLLGGRLPANMRIPVSVPNPISLFNMVEALRFAAVEMVSGPISELAVSRETQNNYDLTNPTMNGICIMTKASSIKFSI